MTVKILLIIVKFVILISLVENKLILKQVVILNRHSLRAPLSNNLKEVSPKTWPTWCVKPGFLTAKGAKLAGYMGSYFAAWLKSEGILPTNCPSEDDLQVFSNTMERTLTTAKSFIENGFPDCKINIQHSDINISNPLFNPIIHNSSALFIAQATEEIQAVLDTLHLNEAYDLLDYILDYNQSRSCKIDKKCNLVEDKNYLSIIPGLKPILSGPLKIGNEVTDAFLMQNYEGFADEDVAWGLLTDSNSWQTVLELNKAYFNAKYRTNLVARDISEPLIKHVTKIFLKDNKPRVALLVASDVNIYTVFKTLLLKPFTLTNQDEVIPIGSAAVFQKWTDDENQEDYFKLSFIYQTTEQLKNCDILSLKSPPKIKTLELEMCTVDENGFCPWNEFETFLTSL